MAFTHQLTSLTTQLSLFYKKIGIVLSYLPKHHTYLLNAALVLYMVIGTEYNASLAQQYSVPFWLSFRISLRAIPQR